MPRQSNTVRTDVVSELKACTECSVHGLCLPAEILPEDFSTLEAIVDCLGPLHAGDHLFRQGDPLKLLYAVRSGYIKTYVNDGSGEEQVLGFYLPGEVAGLAAICQNRHLCSAIVLDTSMVCCIPFDRLNEICGNVPGLRHQLLSKMSCGMVSPMELIGRQTVESRMAGFLLGWGDRLARRGYSANHFVLPMSRHDMASYIRLAPETVSRILTRFRQNKWIEVTRHEVRITDRDALEALCPSGWRI